MLDLLNPFAAVGDAREPAWGTSPPVEVDPFQVLRALVSMAGWTSSTVI